MTHHLARVENNLHECGDAYCDCKYLANNETEKRKLNIVCLNSKKLECTSYLLRDDEIKYNHICLDGEVTCTHSKFKKGKMYCLRPEIARIWECPLKSINTQGEDV